MERDRAGEDPGNGNLRRELGRLDDRIDQLQAELSRLALRLDGLEGEPEGRVAEQEEVAESSAPAAPVMQVTPADHGVANSQEWIPLVGRSLIVLAGAFVADHRRLVPLAATALLGGSAVQVATAFSLASWTECLSFAAAAGLAVELLAARRGWVVLAGTLVDLRTGSPLAAVAPLIVLGTALIVTSLRLRRPPSAEQDPVRQDNAKPRQDGP